MKLDVLQRKMIREYILKCTNEVHPESINLESMRRALLPIDRNITPDKMLSNAEYLEDKGYISIKEVKIAVLEMTEHMIKITSLGMDVVEGSIEDNITFPD